MKHQGFILITVLLFVFLLSLIALSTLETSVNDARLQKQFHDIVQPS